MRGLALYACVAALLTLTGVGTIRLCQLDLDRRLTWLLAPAVGQATLAILLGATVAFGVPLRHASLVLWGLFGLIAFVGIATVARRADALMRDDRPGAWLFLALAAVLPFTAMLPYLLRGGLIDYAGSGQWDGWSYIALGQFYWDYARGTSGGLSPFYQYGAAFSQQRFVAGAELAFFSSIIHAADAQSAFGLVQASAQFSVTAACAAFAWAWGWTGRRTLLYVVTFGLSGWIANVVWANNYDHLLALTYAPALFALVVTSRPLAEKGCLLGVLVAGLLYTYPELAWLPLMGVAVLLADRLRRHREAQIWSPLLRAAAISGVFVLPYLPLLWRFVVSQVARAFHDPVRPGEGMFFGLVDPKRVLSASWALGGEVGLNPHPVAQNLVGLALTAVFVLGLLRLLRASEYGLLLTVGGCIAGAVLFGALSGYSYAVYKFLLTGWWLMVFVLVTGVACLRTRGSTHARGRAMAGGLGLAVVATIPISAVARSVSLARAPSQLWETRSVSVAHFRVIREVLPLVGDEPIGVQVHDTEASLWVLYYLRDQHVRLDTFRGYFVIPWVRASVDRAETIPSGAIRYVVTDAGRALPQAADGGWRVAWSGGPYSLWARSTDAVPERARFPSATGLR